MNSNYTLLQDLYLIVTATNPQNKQQLLEFLDVQLQIEEDINYAL